MTYDQAEHLFEFLAVIGAAGVLSGLVIAGGRWLWERFSE